ncbi:MAG: tetratricopeptide repeat protein [Candidatus Sumerlaeia bacterium]|nr:tetratricopeptide repeat protein [Candidatus Sumerlaeia bacterium]
MDLSEIHRRFATANEHYQNKQFKEALELYRSLIEAGIRDPVLFYNAGNAYAQLGQKGRAIAMYERTLRLAPRHTQAQKNLAYLRPAGAARAPFILWRPFLFVRDRLSLNEWLLLMTGSLVGVAAMWSAWLLLRDGVVRSVVRGLLVAGVLLLLVAGGFAPWRGYVEQGRRVGVVVDSDAVTRHGPSPELGEHLRLAEGTRVRIISREGNGWLCVQPLDSGATTSEHTYLKEESVEEI